MRIRLTGGTNYLNRSGETRIGWCSIDYRGFAEMIERRERAVSVTIRIHELGDEVTDEFSGCRPVHQLTFEQVFLTAVRGVADSGIAGEPLVRKLPADGVE